MREDIELLLSFSKMFDRISNAEVIQQDKEKILTFFKKQLAHDHSWPLREWGYAAIPHRLLAERMVEMPDGDAPEDYKFFVYGGRVHYIQ